MFKNAWSSLKPWCTAPLIYVLQEHASLQTPEQWQEAWSGPSDPAQYLSTLVSKAKSTEELSRVNDSNKILASPIKLGCIFRPTALLNALRQLTARFPLFWMCISSNNEKLFLYSSPDYRRLSFLTKKAQIQTSLPPAPPCLTLREAKALVCSSSDCTFTNSRHLLTWLSMAPSSEGCLRSKLTTIWVPSMLVPLLPTKGS